MGFGQLFIGQLFIGPIDQAVVDKVDACKSLLLEQRSQLQLSPCGGKKIRSADNAPRAKVQIIHQRSDLIGRQTVFSAHNEIFHFGIRRQCGSVSIQGREGLGFASRLQSKGVRQTGILKSGLFAFPHTAGRHIR